MENKLAPRNGLHASEPGEYNLIARIDNQLVDPGGKVKIEIFITGYGNISAAKLVSYPSPGAFELFSSVVRSGLREIGGKLFWGGVERFLDPSGITLDLGSAGFKNPNWKQQTIFVDTGDSPTPQIFTETTQKPEGEDAEGPVTLILKLLHSVNPGTHSVNLLLTYYNDNCWKSSSKTVKFTVRNFYQRNEMCLWIIGFVVGTLLTIIGLS